MAVVVDVLSFSTSVCIAVERGMQVLPYAWKGAGAEEFASRHDAVLAVGRLDSLRDGAPVAPSLSPAGLLACPAVPRLVLPSPNGSTISAALHDVGATVLIGCLRNAAAVANRLAAELGRGQTVVIVAAGERWAADGSLRPALEDHLGAGAVLAALSRLGFDDAMSPEACAAAAVFEGAGPRLHDWLAQCTSGRELVERGFGADVGAASALDASRIVPELVDAWFGAPETGESRQPQRPSARWRVSPMS